MEQDIIDLYTLSSAVRDGLEDLFPEKLWVRAEIGSISVKANGHCYMDLVQSRQEKVLARAKAIIWNGNYRILAAMFRQATGSPLSAGQEILVHAQVNFHEIYGFSLIIDDIDPSFTLGEQQLKRRKTIERLEKEGLMDLQKELLIPALPYCIAVISAEGAAGLGDFREHLLGNAYGFAYRLDFFPATMQGEDAPGSVAHALGLVEGSGTAYDAVVILRGGGSAGDLSCFDEYVMAAAIARCPLPVVTAIGHERDYHVADMAAHSYVKTPTALADLFLESTAAEDERISSYATRLSLAFHNRLSSLLSSVELAQGRVMSSVRARLDEAGAALRLIETRISATDPRNVLKRGFSLALDSRGVRMTSARGKAPGDGISVLFADGRLDAVVGKVTVQDTDNG